MFIIISLSLLTWQLPYIIQCDVFSKLELKNKTWQACQLWIKEDPRNQKIIFHYLEHQEQVVLMRKSTGHTCSWSSSGTFAVDEAEDLLLSVNKYNNDFHIIPIRINSISMFFTHFSNPSLICYLHSWLSKYFIVTVQMLTVPSKQGHGVWLPKINSHSSSHARHALMHCHT